MWVRVLVLEDLAHVEGGAEAAVGGVLLVGEAEHLLRVSGQGQGQGQGELRGLELGMM